MSGYATLRLGGLEPDNLLAFMALLGLLRALEETRPDWAVRVLWTIDQPPVRPALHVPSGVDEDAILDAVADGLGTLSRHHDFGGRKDLALSPLDAATELQAASAATDRGGYIADLWAALASDAAVSRDGKKAEPTPLCLLFGQGHQHFLERVALVPRMNAPPRRGRKRDSIPVSEATCLREALFASWQRPDATPSFRWDPHEDVRYAMRARDPTDSKTKETTQHGANRLAAIGLSQLTVAPRLRNGGARLAVLGGHRDADGTFVFQWPIWELPISLTSIRALLGHPSLGDAHSCAALGVVEVRRARRITSGKFMNFTRASVSSAS